MNVVGESATEYRVRQPAMGERQGAQATLVGQYVVYGDVLYGQPWQWSGSTPHHLWQAVGSCTVRAGGS